MKPDLDLIYSELDLQPNCSLEQFQRAYRKRIAELHPDRSRHASQEKQAALRDLIRVYAMVTRFHRRYGRMPGGYPPHLRRAPSTFGQRPAQISDEAEGSDGGRGRATLTLVMLFFALVVLLASWSWWATKEGPHRGASPTQVPAAPAVVS